MKIKLIVEYFGTPFHGWQRQSGLSTVQESIEEALAIYWNAQAKKIGAPPIPVPNISGSGRTDAGVHALGQVASVQWPDSIPFDQFRFLHAINGITDRALTFRHAEIVADRFDARLTPHVKQYRYQLLLRGGNEAYSLDRAWSLRRNLDIEAMLRAATYFAGTHDFSSFRAGDCIARTTVRTVQRSEFSRISEERFDYIIQAKGFLKHMVRIIVGTLVLVGRKKILPEDIPRIIESRTRTRAGVTAPAKGLVLEWVRYLEKEIHHGGSQDSNRPLEDGMGEDDSLD